MSDARDSAARLPKLILGGKSDCVSVEGRGGKKREDASMHDGTCAERDGLICHHCSFESAVIPRRAG
eukprot:1783840-Rhodomonas_salina.3